MGAVVLEPKQSVTITLDGSDRRFDCYVRFVEGPLAVLGQLGGVVPELSEQLSPGALGYLTSSEGGTPVALRGVATTAPEGSGGLAFVMIDAYTVPERRGAPRIPLATRVRARPIGAAGGAHDAQIETHTVDLSLGGALIEGREGLEVGAQLALELHFEGFPAPVQCEGQVVRRARTQLGIRYTKIGERDRARLAVILVDHQRKLRRQ